MATSTAIRLNVRTIINNYGGNADVYSFDSATKSQNDEGDWNVTSWGSATTVKAISSNNYQLRRLLVSQGEETNSSDRVLIVRDDVTINERDKVTMDSESYIVDEIKLINPIENTTLAKRIVLSKDPNY